MRITLALVTTVAMLFPVATVASDTAVLPTGPSFRVETELFSGGEVQPSSRHLILFDSGVIYEMRLDDERIATMYDPTRKRVVLIDKQNRQTSEISTDDLIIAMARARAAIEQSELSTLFGLDAKPEKVAPEKPGDAERIRLTFGNGKYETTTQPVNNTQIAFAYQQFVILASQLNVARNQGGPLFARVTLNQFIADMGHLPLATELTVKAKDELKPRRYRSQTNVIEQLSQLDRERISELGRIMAECEPVPLSKFQQ